MKILYNANIYTPELKNQTSALLLENGRIKAVGSDEEILAAAQAGTIKENLAGKTLWPGLTDSHIHFQDFSLGLSYVFCETPTKQECLDNVREYAKNHPPGKWIFGWGWNQNVWEDGFGNADNLDKAAPNNPVFLLAKSGHAAWINSAAMMNAGIITQLSDPEGGVISRDVNGQPDGILFETAMDLVYKVLPEPELNEIEEAALKGQQELWKMGLTGIHDFSPISLFNVLQKMDAEKTLKLRVVKGIPQSQLEEAVCIGLRSGFGSDSVLIGSLKLFSDGALGPQTAAMLEPFENSDDCGILLMTADELYLNGVTAAKSGISVAVHAIGDLANRAMLDGFEKLRKYEKKNGLPHLRHRIEHVQLLHKDDLARLADLDVIASVQPIHATSDIDISDKHWEKRAKGAYAFNTLREMSSKLIFGSDAPVETPNPFVGLHAAVTRRRANGYPGEAGWYPQQRLTLAQALHAYSQAPAQATQNMPQTGKIAPGFLADFILMENDPFTQDPQSLHEIKPQATMVNGEWVWKN